MNQQSIAAEFDGAELKAARKAAALSSAEVAQQLGISRRYELQLESGHRSPSTGLLMLIRQFIRLGSGLPATISLTLPAGSPESDLAAMACEAAQVFAPGQRPLESGNHGGHMVSVIAERNRAKRAFADAQEQERQRKAREQAGGNFWGPAMGLPEIQSTDNPIYRSRPRWWATDHAERHTPPRTFRSANDPMPKPNNPLRCAIYD
ncbi:transcriptional regulator with XRE-family HTH domain [Kitasatospora sp. MAP12-15]|uniref:helix-turn-helix domain-containing protein n=1 Tax=unclassified Kitasatospora TaxID=2633591 RepID=UPI002473E7D6|nr:helix-turn-helix domain-containing protein [Kitasatospora sp. MAP12-44]MDH6110210.1 transcriptional regulator with XRE-family HTH domain [Kitasatospora sp. MAP12-44]